LVLVANSKVDIREFVLTLNRPAGTKRGRGRGSFVESTLDLVEEFYTSIVQPIKPIVQPAPKVKAPAVDESEHGTTSVATALTPQAATTVQKDPPGDVASLSEEWTKVPALPAATETE
jgi:hypothetical protein